ncbi:MAG: Rieske (2Fe-2S) protein [Pyrinomonadaceae bacterium]
MKNEEKEIVRGDRRTFLSILPLGVLGAVGATIVVAAGRSLEPQVSSAAEANWKSLGEVAEITGEAPVEKTIAVTCRSGWSKTVEDVSVFVLPKHDNKVLSSVCPHEGCPIVWDDETTKFLCPCHDSYFSDKGERLTGPATKDLTEYETRVESGVLQIKV